MYLKKPETLIWKNVCNPVCTAALFTIARIWKQRKCPSLDEGMKQLWDIYMTEYYLAMKKKKNLPFMTAYMDLENIMLSKINQSERDKSRMISLICSI